MGETGLQYVINRKFREIHIGESQSVGRLSASVVLQMNYKSRELDH